MKALVAAGLAGVGHFFAPGDRQPQIHELAFVHAHIGSIAKRPKCLHDCLVQLRPPFLAGIAGAVAKAVFARLVLIFAVTGGGFDTCQNAVHSERWVFGSCQVARAICSHAVAGFGHGLLCVGWPGTGCGRAGKGGARRRAGH